MSEKEKQSQGMSRRSAVQMLGGTVLGLAVGAAAGWLAKPTPAGEMRTVTQTATGAPATISYQNTAVSGDLYWMHRDNNTEAMKRFMPDFSKTYPNTKVRTEAVAWVGSLEKFVALYAGGNMADVSEAYSCRWIGQFEKELLPLNRYYDALPDESIAGVCPGKKGFFEESTKFCTTTDGRMVGLPIRWSSYCPIYNPQIFEEEGLPKRTPKDWDEYRDWAKLLSKDDRATGKRVRWGTMWQGAGSGVESCVPMVLPYVYSYGGDIFTDDGKTATFTDPAVIQALQYLQDMVIKDESVWPGSASAAAAEQTNMLTHDQVAFVQEDVLTQLGRIQKIDPTKVLAAGPNPAGPEGIFGWPGGMMWCIPKTSKYPDAAWELIKFMNEPYTRNPEFCTTMTAHKDSVNNYKYAALHTSLLEYGLTADLGGAKCPNKLYLHPNYVGILTPFNKAVQVIMNGDNVESTLRTANEEAQRVLGGT